jgi:hypothetical protein
MLEKEKNKMTTGNESHAPVSNSMAAFSRQLNQLADSLSLLYIKNNAGGRRIFRDKWPEVAEYLFGTDLAAYDTHGVKNDEDRERRMQMEDEADLRRIDLKKTMNELIEKSVDSGSLQFEYVGSVVDKYGALLSQFLYEENIIERVRPGALEKAREEHETRKEQENEEQLVATEQTALIEEAAQKPQVFGGQGGSVPQGAVSTDDESIFQPSAASVTQGQSTAEVNELSETEVVQESLQRSEPIDVPEEYLVQQIQSEQPEVSQVGLSETSHAQMQTSEVVAEDDRLSAEEVELLSNKESSLEAENFGSENTGTVLAGMEAELNTDELLKSLEPQQEEGLYPEEEQRPSASSDDIGVTVQVVHEEPLIESDPLDHVRPIETPAPQSVRIEEDSVSGMLSEEQIEPILQESVLEQKREEEQAVLQQQEPFFDDEIVRVTETQALVPDLVQNTAVTVESVEPVNSEALSVEEQQIKAASVVREMLGDETQSLVAPELLNHQEAMVVHNVPTEAELLEMGILQEGDLSKNTQLEVRQEIVIESEPERQEQVSLSEPEPFFDDEIARVKVAEVKPREASFSISVEEDLLREELSEGSEDVVAPLSESTYESDGEGVASVEPALGSENIEEPEFLSESEPFFDDEIARANVAQQERSAEVSMQSELTQPDVFAGNSVVEKPEAEENLFKKEENSAPSSNTAEILKYASAQEVTGPRGEQKPKAEE